MKFNFHFNHNFAIDWDKLTGNLISIVWQLLLTTLIFYLISHFGHKIINNYLTSKSKRPKNKRTRTITALINSVFQYTIIFFYLFGVLSIIGVPVGTLLASAGIFSLALGMGAQGFVTDLVNGFFILSEDQFDVGDTVLINGQVGTVVQLGLRTTRLRSSDGSLIFIQNRNISMVQNLAHNAMSLTINLELDAENDFDQVNEIIKKVNGQIQPERKTIVSGPTILGITKQVGHNITFAVFLKVKPGKESSVRNLYLSGYLKALQKQHIKFAEEPTTITTKNS
ncbi:MULTISPECIES: mechanosensitive ion channel family protein [Lactobacillus]|uniref:Mechanosensitive ion channel family protein n=1 Tax=Lactobacillus xujianguonis TaxID=2495899 RepID=A0A437SUD9_9LACO|nr:MULTISPECIES: mechanosensitive ion channel family protein [Lactobacillus]RVU70553.1 mechanosensitive ion channel family protein [Lactobacillus xujianguonis]RVU77050.1 mechanosensitive ion channel family protein [Lactobacillus xujianguonis]